MNWGFAALPFCFCNTPFSPGNRLALVVSVRRWPMSYPLIPVFVFLVVLLAGGLALIGDASVRLLRGQRR